MGLTWDPEKRQRTLRERGLDFAEVEAVFEGLTVTFEDVRQDYGERRWVTYGLLADRLVNVVWTWRADDRHIISLRKCNDRENARYREQLG